MNDDVKDDNAQPDANPEAPAEAVVETKDEAVAVEPPPAPEAEIAPEPAVEVAPEPALTAEEPADIQRRDNKYFNKEVEELLQYAEDMRLKSMQAQRNRGFVAMSVGLAAIVIGASGFGWFLLVEAALLQAVASIVLGVVVALGLHFWSLQSLNDYLEQYKNDFLPKMAKLLGGFQYHPKRGISRKILSRTGVVPPHDVYEAEDCFMGRYKGIKVMFSEARLKHKKAYLDPIFNGLFVLLEVPSAPIEGHTIITANKDMIQKWGKTRWKKLQSIAVDSDNPSWNRFTGFSDNPASAQKLLQQDLLKELSEAADIFNKAPLTAVFFQKKFVFLMIPYEGDMFEASDIYAPVATKRHAMKCKNEIDQILEIIDVFDIYN